MPTANNLETKKTTARTRRSKNVANLQGASGTIVDHALLQRMRLHWQLGDWSALSVLTANDICNSENTAEAALYVAAAALQLGEVDKAKAFLSIAEQSGIDQHQLKSLLISGVYNTLAVANMLATNDSKVAAGYFSTAAHIALPDIAVPAIVKARTQNQLEQFCQTLPEAHNQALRLSFTSNDKTVSSQVSITDTLTSQYIFDETLQVWRKAQQHSFSYSDGDAIEQRILQAVQSCQDLSIFSQDLLAHQIDWPSEYHLSADRVNLLRPFAEKLAQSDVLELGCGCGAITRYLGETAKSVIAVEGSQQRASIAAARCRDLPEVRVVLDKLQDVPFDGQFDVVTLIGVLEYSQIYVDADEPIQFVLQRALSYLKDDGILLVAIENQLGLKYLAGAPEDHGVGVMAGIQDAYHRHSPITFGKAELEHRLKQAGFAQIDTYLPFPDYKLPCLVVHPKGYPYNPAFDLGTLISTSILYDRQPIRQPLFSQESAWPVFARNNLAADMANSHLFVAYKNKSESITSPQVLASYYSPKRTAHTSQELVFFESGPDIQIRRRGLSAHDSGKESFEGYINGSLHSQLLHKIVQQPGWSIIDVEIWLQAWFDALLLAVVEQGQIPNWPSYDKYLPANYIDAIPRNLIINNNGYHEFIDLEWQLPHVLPLKLVLYRGLVVSLISITSIAAPEDSKFTDRHKLLEHLIFFCGYTLTEIDYKFFVPLCDELSRKAQGLPIPEFLCDKPILMKPFTVRHEQGHYLSEQNFGMTLYWASTTIHFAEENSFKSIYKAKPEPQTIEFEICPQAEGYSKFRFDISESEGCFIVSHIGFYNQQGSLLWSLGQDTTKLKNLGQLSIFKAVGSNEDLCLISQGNDPQFEFILSEEVLNSLSGGGYFRLTLRSYI